MDFVLEQFEGPLDLLLHLIKTNKIDIYDIPVFELSQQYIQYLKKMEELDMDIASEFIVMASELLYIKSKMLLPSSKLDGEDENDPRQELVQKLIDYKKYSEMSSFFKEREYIGFNSYTKTKEKIKGLNRFDKITMEKESLNATMNTIAQRIISRVAPEKTIFTRLVEREVVSVSEMKDKLLSVLKGNGRFDLVDAFVLICRTRAEIVAAFTSLLELIKSGKIDIYENNDNFFLELCEI